MRAVAVFPHARQVRVVDRPEPVIASPHDVKLRILEVGVCGTDRDLCAFQFGSAPAGEDYFVLGHESLAEVAATGDAVTTVRPGDLVVAVVRKPCATAGCTPCAAGRQDFCASGRYIERGIQDLHGFMTSYVVEEDRYIYAVPRHLREVAVLVEPLTIAEKSFTEFSVIEQRYPWPRSRRTAVVLGAGPVGLLGAMLFVEAGFDTWVYSRSREPNAKAAIAREVGAEYVSSLDTTAAEFASRTGNIDVMYEAMGAPQAAFDVLQHLGANGIFIFTGVPAPGATLNLDLHRLLPRLVLRNQVVLGTVNAGPHAFPGAIAHLDRFHQCWPHALARIITGRFPIDEYREAIFGPVGIKNIIAME